MQPLPDRPGDHRLLWSQLNGLGANAAILWLEGAPRDDVDSDAQQFSQILEQADMINKGGTRLEIYEQVQIAVWASLSPGDGAEYRDPVRPALPRDAEDLRAAAAQRLQGQHVIGHDLKYRRIPGRRFARCCLPRLAPWLWSCRAPDQRLLRCGDLHVLERAGSPGSPLSCLPCRPPRLSVGRRSGARWKPGIPRARVRPGMGQTPAC
jgi:hypothetical protein